MTPCIFLFVWFGVGELLHFFFFTILIKFLDKSQGLYIQNLSQVCVLFLISTDTLLDQPIMMSYLNCDPSFLTIPPASTASTSHNSLSMQKHFLKRPLNNVNQLMSFAPVFQSSL